MEQGCEQSQVLEDNNIQSDKKIKKSMSDVYPEIGEGEEGIE